MLNGFLLKLTPLQFFSKVLRFLQILFEGFPFYNRTVATVAHTMTSLARTVASLARTVSKPFPTSSLPLPPGSSSVSIRRGRQAEFYPPGSKCEALLLGVHLISVQPVPPVPSNSACRPRRVDAELDPGGRGKELVGKGLDTVSARLATVLARLVIVCPTLATVRF